MSEPDTGRHLCKGLCLSALVLLLAACTPQAISSEEVFEFSCQGQARAGLFSLAAASGYHGAVGLQAAQAGTPLMLSRLDLSWLRDRLADKSHLEDRMVTAVIGNGTACPSPIKPPETGGPFSP